MAKIKEVHFFDNENNFKKNLDYSKYHSSFHNKLINSIKGETTPIYMYWSEAPKRIWQYNPRMKIIVVLRNPIDRAFSHWNMERGRNNDDLSFTDALRNESDRCRETLPLQHRIYSYVDRGFYSDQIRKLWHFFSKDQVLILKHEDLKNELSSTLCEISDFLEIENFPTIKYENHHSKKYISSMNENDYLYLNEKFSNEIKSLKTMPGWDCSDWLEQRVF
jgi:hypothetical protein